MKIRKNAIQNADNFTLSNKKNASSVRAEGLIEKETL
jgi:hypothetical protein